MMSVRDRMKVVAQLRNRVSEEFGIFHSVFESKPEGFDRRHTPSGEGAAHG